MAYNREELARRALKELRLIGEGQAASAEETAEALGAIDPLLARLEWLNVYTPANRFVFADGVFHSLALLLAEDLAAPLAGRPASPGIVEMHQDRLRRICRQPLNRNELTFDSALGAGRRQAPWS